MIQIAAQIRILVAVEAIDGRKGIDAIAQLCREKLNADPFSGYLFIWSRCELCGGHAGRVEVDADRS